MTRERVSDIEIKWAIQQLTAMGMLERHEDSIKLTDAGFDRAFAIERTLGIQERFLLMVMYYQIQEVVDGQDYVY